MSRRLLIAAGLLAGSVVPFANAAGFDHTPLEATTAAGEPVRLFPNGRWEFVDVAKAEAARKAAAEYPENKTRPVDAQGGAFGVGRLIMPGDKDYNRGSLNPKTR